MYICILLITSPCKKFTEFPYLNRIFSVYNVNHFQCLVVPVEMAFFITSSFCWNSSLFSLLLHSHLYWFSQMWSHAVTVNFSFIAFKVFMYLLGLQLMVGAMYILALCLRFCDALVVWFERLIQNLIFRLFCIVSLNCRLCFNPSFRKFNS